MTDSEQPEGKRTFKPTLITWVMGAIALYFVVVSTAKSGVSGLLIMAGLIALITAIYTLVSGKQGWAKLPSKRIAAFTLAASIIILTAGGAIAAPVDKPLSAPATVHASEPTPTTTPTSRANPGSTAAPIAFTDEDPGDPAIVAASLQRPSVVILDRAVTQTTALTLLSTLPIKGKAPKTGYDRSEKFGTAWLDVDRNGCDTRNDILARDLTPQKKEGSCKVLNGTLADPYTATTILFVRGQSTSALVQIDHVVSLSNAWQTGAQQITQAQRISLANDPLNLFAVDGRSNAQKGAGDTATWLPPSKSFRCTYVAHQVSVKATYGLWVTQPEHDAMVRVLSNCNDQKALSSDFAPIPAPLPPAQLVAPVQPAVPPPAAEQAPAPAAPAPPAPAPAPPAVGVVHPGAFCSTSGATGVTKTGKAMVCITTAEDSRLRWRAA